MTNIEKYNKVFMDIFEVGEADLAGLKYKSVPAWDSVGQMTLIAEIEETFDITIGPDDFMLLNSYEEGKRILKENYQIEL
jgi:acyl carrier protein